MEKSVFLLHNILENNANSINALINLGVIETLMEEYLEAISFF